MTALYHPSALLRDPRKRPESPAPSPAAYGRRPSAADTAGRVRRTVFGAARTAGRNSSSDSGAANTPFRSILSCLSLNFAKNRFSRKIGFRQKTSAFFRKTREISVFIAKKQRCFSENVLFFHFFRKNIDFRVSTSRKRITFAPEEQNTLCRGSKSESLRCCFFRF